MSRRKKILILSIAPASTSSWYRILRPFEMLARSMPIDCTILSGSEVDWTTFTGIDLVFAQRPGGEGHDTILQRARDRGIPVIADYDDALLDVPFHHVDFLTYADERWRNSTKRCLALADQLWVTNSCLEKNLIKHGAAPEKVSIIPNAIDDYLFPTPTVPHDEQSNVVVWRGGHTHDFDLLKFKDKIQDISMKSPLIFFGTKPWMLELPKDRFSFVPAFFDPEEFFRKLRSIAGSWHIVPLVDDEFNRCKSNIAYLEASWFGASQVITPDWWSEMGACQFDQPWAQGEDRVELVREAQAYIADKFRLSIVNGLRAKKIGELLRLD